MNSPYNDWDRLKKMDDDPFFKDSNKWLRKAIITRVIVSVLLIICCVAYVIFALGKLRDASHETKQMIGRNVVMGRDTLVVVDYSMIKQSYTLSNGLEISNELAENLVVKDR